MAALAASRSLPAASQRSPALGPSRRRGSPSAYRAPGVIRCQAAGRGSANAAAVAAPPATLAWANGTNHRLSDVFLNEKNNRLQVEASFVGRPGAQCRLWRKPSRSSARHTYRHCSPSLTYPPVRRVPFAAPQTSEVGLDTTAFRGLDWDRERFDIEFGLQARFGSPPECPRPAAANGSGRGCKRLPLLAITLRAGGHHVQLVLDQGGQDGAGGYLQGELQGPVLCGPAGRD